ncbi:MAG: GTPase Era [Lachnospiraceae bacterium]|nr:GTPase Era [Lachnospiraceae bacterium]
MEQKKSGFAAIIGRPNVGKSTLMNHLIGQKIAITSDRPQTTRSRIETVLTTDEGQIVFVDTPGFLRKAANRLGEYMMDVSVGTLADADVVLWLIEPSSYIGEGDREIAEALGKVKTPVVLVVNKLDTIKKEQLLGIIDSWKDLYDFAEIVPVSGLKGKNLDELISVIMKYLPEGPLLYYEDTLTDQPMRVIAAEVVREKALRLLDREVPHGIAVTIERYRTRDDGLTEIEASIICEKESHKGIIIGRGGSMLKRIGTAARRELEDMTEGKVFLKLFVKVRKDWRDNETLLRDYGYTKNRNK